MKWGKKEVIGKEKEKSKGNKEQWLKFSVNKVKAKYLLREQVNDKCVIYYKTQ